MCAGVDDQNNGKASILKETIRLLGELATQMDALKDENATLLSEYNYVRDPLCNFEIQSLLLILFHLLCLPITSHNMLAMSKNNGKASMHVLQVLVF